MGLSSSSRFPEFHKKLLRLGKPSGPDFIWTSIPSLTKEENLRCISIWHRWLGLYSMVTSKDRKFINSIYARIYENNKPEGV